MDLVFRIVGAHIQHKDNIELNPMLSGEKDII
jgi:hypothetical protein